MRLIGNLPDQDQAFCFSNFLRSKKIPNSIEPYFNEQDAKASFELWVHEEDQVDEAVQYFDEFQKDPDNQKFKVEAVPEETTPPPAEEIQPKPALPKPKTVHPMTFFWIALCGLVYLVNFMQEVNISKGKEVKFVALTPIQYYMLYDIPTVLIKLNEWINTYQIQPDQKSEDLSPDAKAALDKIESTPTWRGAYDYVVLKWIKKDKRDRFGPPTFQKIREGEVWRVFTPAILHKDLLHILFNMIWVWVLGKQIEERISRWKYFLMVIIVAIISNTAQYLMSGPYFLGFSGVVMGMAGFIWMRQRKAPWEGYPLHPSTFLFLGFFILAMIFLQVVSFFMQIFGSDSFAFNIANTAHIAGALVGMGLGKLSFYSWRPR